VKVNVSCYIIKLIFDLNPLLKNGFRTPVSVPTGRRAGATVNTQAVKTSSNTWRWVSFRYTCLGLGPNIV